MVTMCAFLILIGRKTLFHLQTYKIEFDCLLSHILGRLENSDCTVTVFIHVFTRKDIPLLSASQLLSTTILPCSYTAQDFPYHLAAHHTFRILLQIVR
jgi:hypothetical protein